VNPDPARGETGRTDNCTKNYAPNGDQHVMEKRTREGGKVNYELPEYLASKVMSLSPNESLGALVDYIHIVVSHTRITYRQTQSFSPPNFHS
jgi:hypothetical protein